MIEITKKKIKVFFAFICALTMASLAYGQSWHKDEMVFIEDGYMYSGNAMTDNGIAESDMTILNFNEAISLQTKHEAHGIIADVYTDGYVEVKVYSYNSNAPDGLGNIIYWGSINETTTEYDINPVGLGTIWIDDKEINIGDRSVDVGFMAQEANVYVSPYSCQVNEDYGTHNIWKTKSLYGTITCHGDAANQPVISKISGSKSTVKSIKIPGVSTSNSLKDIFFLGTKGFDRMAIIGNYGCQNALGTPAVASKINDIWKPDFILSSGNDSYHRLYPSQCGADFQANVGDYYGDFIKDPSASSSELNRFFSIPGPMDYEDDSGSHLGLAGEQQWLNYFQRSSTYYSFTWGEAEFFMLNTNNRQGPGTDPVDNADMQAMKTWLTNALNASTQKYKVVLGHHAPYASKYSSSVMQTWDFKAMGADIYISSGGDFYERHDIGGIPYVVNGLGGFQQDGTVTEADYLPSMVEGTHYNAKYGALLVDSGKSYLRFMFMTEDDEMIDDFYIFGNGVTYYNKRGAEISSANEAMDIYILLGQSNASGREAHGAGWRSTLEEDLVELPNAYLLNEFGTFEHAYPCFTRYSSVGKWPWVHTIGAGWTFAKKISEEANVNIGMIVNPRGGTNMEKWGKNYVPTDDEKELWGKYSYGYGGGNLYNETLRRVNEALTNYPNAVLKGVIWQHGESDANNVNERGMDYGAAAADWFTQFRSDLNAPNLVYLVGETSELYYYNDPQYGDWRHPILNAQINDIPNHLSDVYVASSSGLKTWDGSQSEYDGGHFTMEAQKEFGERFADLALEHIYNMVPTSRESPKIKTKEDITLNQTDWLVYPNPAADQINLVVPNREEITQVNYFLYDILGQLVLKNTVKESDINRPIPLILRELKKDLYILKLQTNIGTKSFKIIKSE